MSYYRASTSNPNGWRPGTVRLGTLDRSPDWKHTVAAVDRAQQMHARWNAMQGRRTMKRLMTVDAAARGDRGALHGLAGLGLLDNNSTMVQGANYVFYFTYSTLGINPTPGQIQLALSGDSNFATVVPFDTGDGRLAVSFVYAGGGSTVVNAGAEMQNVINSNNAQNVMFGNIFAASVTFAGADGGAASAPAQTTPIPSGVNDAQQQQQQQQPKPFNLSNFLAGLGIGGGAALALGTLGLVLVMRD